jgi:hypothetical protein
MIGIPNSTLARPHSPNRLELAQAHLLQTYWLPTTTCLAELFVSFIHPKVL